MSDTKIYPYQANEPLAVLGTFKAVVSTTEKQVQTKFYVVKGKSGAILCKSSAEKQDMLRVGPCTPAISPADDDIPIAVVNHHVPTTSVKSTLHILNKHHKVFQGIGLLKKFELKLHIDNDFIPIQQPIRRIPFHTREKVEAEINRLQELDII